MKTEQLLPFDYETAIRDISRVVTRSGRTITELYLLKTSNEEQPVIAVVDGEMETFKRGGKYNTRLADHENDLFLLPEKVVRYQIIAVENVQSYYASKKMAMQAAEMITESNRVVGITEIATVGRELISVEIVHRYTS